jgi:predicted transglutaminase-like cysteine proteinase
MIEDHNRLLDRLKRSPPSALRGPEPRPRHDGRCQALTSTQGRLVQTIVQMTLLAFLTIGGSSTPTRAVRLDAAIPLRGVAGTPELLRSDMRFIRLNVPTLAPMAFTQFCLRYTGECRPRRLLFRGGRLKLTGWRWAELELVNRRVNMSIVPQRNNEGLAGQKWSLSPPFGDCNDYAVTKRHELIARGWPSRAVLLSEVVTSLGEHHLVTVVRASGGDLVLDNLTSLIVPWFEKPYHWLRIQTPGNPLYWSSIRDAT